MIAVVRRVFVTDHFTIEAQHRASGPLRSICDRWSGLLVVIHPFRQAEPRMHRLLPDRVAGRRKGRRVERTYGNPADRWVAVSFPIKRGAAIRAEMKLNPNNRCRRRARRPSAPHRAAPALLENLRRNGKQYRCGADTPCSGTDKPDPVHLWQLLEASRSGTARFVPSISSRPHLLTTLADLLGCCRAGFNKKPFRRTSNSSQRVQSRRSKNRAGGRELRRAR
jgi:hypothetical protein